MELDYIFSENDKSKILTLLTTKYEYIVCIFIISKNRNEKVG